MKQIVTQYISVFFILLILTKGIGATMPLVQAIWNNGDELELLTENNTEAQQKKAGRLIEGAASEELFDHLLAHYYPAAPLQPGRPLSVYFERYIPAFWQEVQTPPPDFQV